MAKRDRLQVLYDILKVIQNKPAIKPTHIMYKANLSSKMLSEYLQDLVSRNFVLETIGKDKRSKTYDLSEKGHAYVSNYSVVQEFVETYGLD
jgi:predicted transcriptional regulator